MGFTVYDSLVNRGPDLKPTPWLAESWEVGADASEWIFQLRKGVEWHDGKLQQLTSRMVQSFCAWNQDGSPKVAASMMPALESTQATR